MHVCLSDLDGSGVVDFGDVALALHRQGARVGLFDADIYGPSQPLMLGVTGRRPQIVNGNQMVPITAHGIKCNSVGFLVDDNQAMVWRGPMVVGAFNQILNDTSWGELDYLIIDMPPGTGDIQLSLAQSVPVTGAVIVTTPQDVALLDAKRGIEMFRKVQVPILGVVENMGLHICSQCGHSEHMFGEGGADRIAYAYDVHRETLLLNGFRTIFRAADRKLSLYQFKTPKVLS